MPNQANSSRSVRSEEQLRKIDDAADRLTISRRSVWRLIAAGELEVVRLGRSVRVKASSIDALIERGGVK